MSTVEISNSSGDLMEQWWHRLLRVMMYGSTVVVFALTGVALVPSEPHITYSYSFDPYYDLRPGASTPCRYVRSADKLDCGAFTNSKEFVSHLLEIKGFKAYEAEKSNGAAIYLSDCRKRAIQSRINEVHRKDLSPDERKKLDQIVQLAKQLGWAIPDRSKRDSPYHAALAPCSDAELAELFLKAHGISYRMDKHWNIAGLTKGILYTLGISALWFLLALVSYKVILFVAHGLTRIPRP